MNYITYFTFILLVFSCNKSNIDDKEKIVEINHDLNEYKTDENDSNDEWIWKYNMPLIWSRYHVDTTIIKSFNDVFKAPSKIDVLYINDPKNINSLPKGITELQNLKEFWLWINISDIEKTFRQLSQLPNLKKLSIRELKYIPESIVELKNLEAITLNVGAFDEVPECICQMKNLRYIRLYNSRKLNSIPNCIGELINLEYLDIAGTKISKLPESLGNCQKLRTITANACKIKFIDKAICNLPNLSHLNLGSNLIGILPENFGNLTKLEGLDLGSNNLRDLPKSIEKMKQLQYAHLDKNNFDEIPSEILQLKNLYSLWIHGNKVYDIPVNEIVNSNLKRILIDTVKINKDTLDKLRLLKPNLKIVHY